MAHRTLNSRTAFYGDARENGYPEDRERQRRARLGKRAKDTGVYAAWAVEFPGVPFPDYYGSVYDAYQQLEARGWKFSSRYGWRKVSGGGGGGGDAEKAIYQ